MKLLHKNIIGIFLVFFFFSLIFIPVQAAVTPFRGQNHDYSVTFRGNGEAAVEARIVFTNQIEKDKKKFTFSIPKVKTDDLVILQQKLEGVCKRYDYSDRSILYEDRECLEYRDPDYTNSYYYGEQDSEYFNADYETDGQKITVTLPEPVKSQDSSALIISYYAFGYTSERLGRFSFDFETFQVDERIRQLDVSAGVDSDLILKDQKSEVNYIPVGEISDSNLSAGTDNSLKSPALDDAVSQIGTGGLIQKSAKNLADGESFTVSGEYSKQWLSLYYDRIILSILIVVALLAGFWFVARSYKSKKQKKQVSSSTETETTNQPVQFGPKGMLELLAGLLSAVVVVLLVVIISYLQNSEYLPYTSDEFVNLFRVLISLLLFVLAIFGPAIFVGAKKGWRSVLAILAFELGWFMIFMVLYTVIFPSGVQQSDPYPGVYDGFEGSLLGP